MAISYKWNINQMDAHIESEGETNVIFNVHWTYTGSEESGGKTYTDDIIGSEQFTYTAGNPFVPYENTEAFENIVIGWLEGVLDVDELKAQIDAEIQNQISPKDEILTFTWQND